MSNPLQRLNAAGQSVWFDHIHRGMLTGGELTALIDHDDLRGVTSNPSIFDKAITGGHDYDELIKRALHQQPTLSSRELFYTLAIEDIRAACDVLRPVYDKTDGMDGMVSLEVSPDLAHDAEATVREAHELRARLDRPNAMIKVPATVACLPAIEQLVADGFNINVTLLFAVERYAAVAEAYLRGLERRVAQGLPVARVESVASFFVSRVDAALDPQVAAQRPELQGQLAVANAKLAYAHFQALYASERFAQLQQAGARPQRLLWASTSTKNPAYSDLLYVETLIGPQTVNTMPPATYEAFRDHGTVAQTLTENLATAKAQIAALAELGIDLTAVTDRLEAEGVAAFAKSFENLLHHLAGKAAALTA